MNATAKAINDEFFELLSTFAEKKDLIKDQNNVTKFLLVYEMLNDLNIDVSDLILTGKWYSVTEMAELLKVTPQKLGKLITEYGLRGNEEFSRGFPVKVSSKKYAVTWIYNERAFELIGSAVEID